MLWPVKGSESQRIVTMQHVAMIEKLQYRIHKFENMPIWKRLIVAIRGKLD